MTSVIPKLALYCKMKNLEDKREVMKNKGKLRDTKIYIENGRTKEETNVDYEIRKR